MKKSLIALAALSAFATAAQAQSSVTVYGTLDAGYDKLTTTNTTAGVSVDTTSKGGSRTAQGALTSSRIGFKGTEDIGGGLKANFNLEYEINPGTGRTATGAGDGATTAQMRTSTVGLQGNFGAFNIGRQLTGIHNVIAGFSPLSGNNMVGDLSYSAATRLHATEVRADNSISYITPTMNGFNARVDYAADSAAEVSNVPNSGTKTDHLGLSANYATGALKLAAATHTTKTKAALVNAVAGRSIVFTAGAPMTAPTSTAGNCTAAALTAGTCVNTVMAVTGVTAANDEAKARVNAYTAQYTVGSLTLNALIGDRKVTTEGVVDAVKSKYQQVGAAYAMGNVTLVAQYGQGDIKFSAVDKDDRKAYQLGAIYNLSKRTNLYAVYGEQEQKVATSPVLAEIGDKVKSTQYAVGLRHSF
jgi:predicted porin